MFRPILTLILALTVLFVPVKSSAGLINAIVVIVNDSVVTYDEVERSIASMLELLAGQYGNQPRVFEKKVGEVRSEQIERLVENELVLYDFNKAGYNLPESIVDDILNVEIKKQFGDRVTLTKTLQAQGETYEKFRKRRKEAMIINYLKDKNTSSEKIIISPYKIESYYKAHQEEFKLGDQVKLRMISLNKTTETKPAEVRKLAEEILAKIKSGTSFSEMASVYSDGAQRAQGGDRGWIERSFYKKEISDVAFALKTGEISQVLDLPEACYILLVEEVRETHTRPLADIREEIEKTLKSQEAARLNKKWIDRLKRKAYVRYF